VHGINIEEELKGKNGWKIFELLAAIKTNTVIWIDVSSDFKEKHGLPGRDIGIDSCDNDIAIQAKYYRNTESITFTDLSTFIAASGRCLIPFIRLIVVTLPDVKITQHLRYAFEVLVISPEDIKVMCNDAVAYYMANKVKVSTINIMAESEWLTGEYLLNKELNMSVDDDEDLLPGMIEPPMIDQKEKEKNNIDDTVQLAIDLEKKKIGPGEKEKDLEEKQPEIIIDVRTNTKDLGSSVNGSGSNDMIVEKRMRKKMKKK